MRSTVEYVVCAAALCLGSISEAQTLDWIRQFSFDDGVSGYGVAADQLGNVFITGQSFGSVDVPNFDPTDSFVAKYDSGGSLHWIRQFGTTSDDNGWDISVDGMGNVYISGFTRGSFDGMGDGGIDPFLSKYDSDGALQWIRQFGTSGADASYGVTADGMGSVYVTGETDGNLGAENAGLRDVFLAKYSEDGDHVWTRQFGSTEVDVGESVSADRLGNVYVTGWTTGTLGETHAGTDDAFVTKFDSDGMLQWTRQFGRYYTHSKSASTDDLGNVYISGFTRGALAEVSAGGTDAFLAKYDEDGNRSWIQQLGTRESDYSHGVSTDGHGRVFIAGYTYGNLGETSAGSTDAFVSSYDERGNLLWTRQLGTPRAENGRGVSADGRGNVYTSGYTLGDFSGNNIPHGFNVFVAKLIVVPEPGILDLTSVTCMALLSLRRRQRMARLACPGLGPQM